MTTTYRAFRQSLTERERAETFTYGGRSWNIARARYIALRRNRPAVVVSVIDVLLATNTRSIVRELWLRGHATAVCDRPISYDYTFEVDIHRPLVFGVIGMQTPIGSVQARVLLDGAHRLVRAIRERRPFLSAHVLDESMTSRCEVFYGEASASSSD